jgi:hypothetical protein
MPHTSIGTSSGAATLAASSHNTQPWNFRLEAKRISILPDLSRRCPMVDPDNHHLFVSLGCAAENLLLAAQAAGLHGELTFETPAGSAGVLRNVIAGAALVLRGRPRPGLWLPRVAWAGLVLSTVLLGWTAWSGGHIRHEEVRAAVVAP